MDAAPAQPVAAPARKALPPHPITPGVKVLSIILYIGWAVLLAILFYLLLTS